MKIKEKTVYKSIPLIIIIVNLMIHFDYSIFKMYAPYVAYVNLLMYVWLLLIFWRDKFDKREFIYLTVSIIYAFLTSFFNGNSLGAIVAYLELFFVIYSLSRFSFSRHEIRIIALAAIIISIRYIFIAKDLFVLWTAEPEKYVNPNAVGMILYFSFTIICIMQLSYGYKKSIMILIWGVLIIAEYLLRCRTYTIVSIFSGICLFFIPFKIWENKKSIKFLIVLVTAAGCIFPYLYAVLSTNEQLSIFVYKLTGKYMFTGREYTWINFFSYEREHKKEFIIGAGSWIESTFSERFSLHNSYLGIIMNFGILGLVLYAVYLLKVINNIYRKRVSDRQIVLLISFMGFMIASCTEVVLQTPISAVLVGAILAQARVQESDSRQKVGKSEVVNDYL